MHSLHRPWTWSSLQINSNIQIPSAPGYHEERVGVRSANSSPRERFRRRLCIDNWPSMLSSDGAHNVATTLRWFTAFARAVYSLASVFLLMPLNFRQLSSFQLSSTPWTHHESKDDCDMVWTNRHPPRLSRGMYFHLSPLVCKVEIVLGKRRIEFIFHELTSAVIA